MILYIVRHAWAGEHGDPQYPDDDLRPLTAKGIKRFRRVVKRLVKRGFDPLFVATSPLVRCRETAEIVSLVSPREPSVTELEELRPGARAEALMNWTREHATANIAWVGHAPDVGHLVAAMIGDGNGQIAMEKGGVAAIEFEGPIAPGQGTLVWLATAELLGR
jgi:phosphohistidine phosphatase